MFQCIVQLVQLIGTDRSGTSIRPLTGKTIDVANIQNVLYNFWKKRSFTFFSILFLVNISERKFIIQFVWTFMRKFNISMDIYDEIFILWPSIFLNLSIHWHLERYSTWIVFNGSLYYITRSFARSFTFFFFKEHGLQRSLFSTFLVLYGRINPVVGPKCGKINSAVHGRNEN